MKKLDKSGDPRTSWLQVCSLAFLVVFFGFWADLSQQIHADSEGAIVPGTYSGAVPTKYPSWFKDSFLEFEDDVAEAAEQGKRLILFFHQDGCPYCNALVERNFSQKDIVEKIREHFDVVELNIWGDRSVVSVDGIEFTEKEFSAEAGVQFTPTLLFYDERGDSVLKLNGYIPPKQFRVALDYVSGRHEAGMSYRDFVERNLKGDAASKKLIPEPFFASPPYSLDRLTSQEKPIAVFFEQEDCPNCEILHSKVLVDREVKELIGNFDAVQMGMWSKAMITTPSGKKTTIRDWAAELGVSYAPTIVFFDRHGKEVIRSEAWFKIFHTQSMLDYVSSEAFRVEPNFQRYVADRADRLIEKGIDVDIWK